MVRSHLQSNFENSHLSREFADCVTERYFPYCPLHCEADQTTESLGSKESSLIPLAIWEPAEKGGR